MPSTPTAKTILRSRNASAPDKVLSTLLVRMPRCILAEFNTHRVFSRNAASTRAIPTRKLIEQVMDDPFIPLVWGMNIAGMQAAGVHDNPASCERNWLRASDAAVKSAESMLDLGLHKQIAGRILEPWMWTIVCVSATEWDNFLELRDHHAAEPHIQMLAREIRKCLEGDQVQELQPGEWHLPFVDDDLDFREVDGTVGSLEDHIKLSVARCASTSYKTVDGFDMTLEKAIEVYDKLSGKPFHASPFEHVAQADDCRPVARVNYGWHHREEHGNFIGFRQLRRQMELAA